LTPAVCDIGSLVAKDQTIDHCCRSTTCCTRVRDVANAAAADPSAVANAADATSSLRMSYAAEGDPTAGFGFEARVVPENVTLLPKTSQGNGASDWSERLIIAKKSETIGSILRELGAAPDEIKQHPHGVRPGAARRRPQGRPEAARAHARRPASGHMQPLRVIIVGDSGIQPPSRSPTPANTFRSISATSIPPWPMASDTSGEDDSSGVRLYQSIYETALRNNVPNSVIEESGPHLFLRRRLPAQSAAGRLVRRALFGRRERRRQERGALRLAHGRRR
jgi:hypothetical protein